MGRLHDTLLVYTKGDTYTFNAETLAYDQGYLKSKYRYVEPDTGRLYRLDNLTGPGGAAKGNPEYEVMGVVRYWRYSRDRMDALVAEGRIIQTKPGTVPQYKRYLDEMPGVPLQDIWTDIDPINSRAAERLGYPTQKPLSLLERVIKMSSDEGAVVLDPFCGCGTAVDAAQKLGRQWIGIDVTYLAIDLIDKRLRHSFGNEIAAAYEILGIPRDVASARALFLRNPFEFERWAVSLVDGQPNEKQVGDRGIDGVIRYPIDAKGTTGRILVSVKGGQPPGPQAVRDLIGAVHSQRADMGVFIAMEDPTPRMAEAANASRLFHAPAQGRSYPVVQIITVEQLLAGKKPNLPPVLLPYIQAQRHAASPDQLTLGD